MSSSTRDITLVSSSSTMQGALLFAGANVRGKSSLWVTDGTAAGTHELTGIQEVSKDGLLPSDLTIYNGKVLFAGTDANNKIGLWATDGTAAGTHELTGIQGASKDGLSPYNLTPYNGKVLFMGRDASGKGGLWVTDGTAAGTHELTGIQGVDSKYGLSPENFTPYNGKVLFAGQDASGKTDPKIGLWVTDGTAAGTHELTGIQGVDSKYGLSPYNLTPCNGKILFRGNDASGKSGLWVTDGTVAGTYELTGIQGASKDGLSPVNFTFYNDKVLFAGTDANNKIGLWATDGTAAGTYELIQGASKDGLIPTDLTPYNGRVLFGGDDANGKRSLWVTNGTTVGTYKITGIQGVDNKDGLWPEDFASASDKTYNLGPRQGDGAGGDGGQGGNDGNGGGPGGGGDGTGGDPVGTTITANFIVYNQAKDQQIALEGEQYTDPARGIVHECIQITPDSLNITAISPNVFIYSGIGNDAINVSQANGNNILDGGAGSNFLIGGTGADQFYIDDRYQTAITWSTIANFHSGDKATVWGVSPQDFQLTWLDGQGVPGATGLTAVFSAPGKSMAEITLSGFTTADLNNGKLAVSYGRTADQPGLPSCNYMYITAT